MSYRISHLAPRGLAVVALAAFGCSDGAPGPGPGTNAGRPLDRPLIMDQLHNGGTEGFLLLPPMVPRPASIGDNIPLLPVTVRVDEIDGQGNTKRSLATFTSEDGPKKERLRYYAQGQRPDPDDDDGDTDQVGYYLARWKTADENLSLQAIYRVRVYVPARAGKQRELGFADVDVVRNQKEFRSVDQQNFAPLINGEVLRIKFRVDRPAVDADGDGVFDWKDNCPTTPNADQTDSMRNGVGDACRCAAVKCAPMDSCHAAGVCNPKTGACEGAVLPDGTKCPAANATATCKSGGCQIVACDNGWKDVNGKIEDGCEEKAGGGGCGDTTKDINNCGACGNVCSTQSGTPSCVSGVCGIAACGKGFADCNKFSIDGCETDLMNNPAHCGACLNKCITANGTATCNSGLCGLGACDKGFANCNNLAGDGCEVNLGSDAQNCGACGRMCSAGPNAVPVCRNGGCSISCTTRNHADCDGNHATGCEANLASDNLNCGGCGIVCENGATCQSGSCVAPIDCQPGTADCNGDPIDKCEVRLDSDANNCGACGVVCSFDHAFPSCILGGCGFIVCHMGYADCDGQQANGCEVGLTSDAANCGACGNACAAGEVCSAGSCVAQVAHFSRGMFAGHGCAVMSGGSLRCWGDNTYGQLGDGTTTNHFTPVTAVGLTDVVQVSTSGLFTCVLHGDGTVKCWGTNGVGMLGSGIVGGTSLTPSPVLRAPGVPLDRVLEITSGSAHTCARRDDATVWCWGYNGQGQLGDGTTTSHAFATQTLSIPTPVSIAAGYNFTCMATNGNGSVLCWGYGDSIAIPGAALFQSTPLAMPNLVGAVEVGAGQEHTCARILNGTVRCWGSNIAGQLGDGTNTDSQAPVTMIDSLGAALTGAVELSVTHTRSCVRVIDGSVRCAGTLPGDGTYVDANRAQPVLESAGGPVLKGIIGLGHASAGTFLIRGANASGLAFGRPAGDGTNFSQTSPVPILF